MRVQASLGRCLRTRSFFRAFYDSLFSRSSAIRRRFAGVDMDRQTRVIEDGVLFLVKFAAGSAASKSILQRIARVHGPSRVNVEPSLYQVWLDVLMETVRAHDDRLDAELEAAWRRVMQVGIDFFVAEWKRERAELTR